MDQILLNYLFVFIGPALVGLLLRLCFLRIRRAYWVTAALVLLAAAAWVVAHVVPNRGSELYGIVATQMTCAAAASLLVGLLIRLCRLLSQWLHRGDAS